MNKGVIKLSLFFLPLLLIMGVAELALRNLPNSYKIKNSHLKEQAADVEMLVLGHSQLLFGLNPEFLDIPTYNMAHVSQTYTYDLMIIDHYKLRKLKYVVLPVDYFSFYEEEQSTPKLNHMYRLNYGLAVEGYSLEITSFSPRHNLRRLYKYNGIEEEELRQNKYGFGTNFTSSSTIEIGVSARLAAARHKTDRNSFHPNSIAALESILKNESLIIILVSMPVHPKYVEMIEKDKLLASRHYAADLARLKSHIQYIEAQDLEIFTDEDFYDADHLNHAGAEKMSKSLNRWMQDLLITDVSK